MSTAPLFFLAITPTQSVFRFALASSSLAIPSTRSMLEWKYEKIEGCKQSKPCILTRIFEGLKSLAKDLTSSQKLVRKFESNP